jgi:hypothetical protein
LGFISFSPTYTLKVQVAFIGRRERKMFKKWIFTGVVFLVMILPGLGFAQAGMEADKQSLLSAFVSYTELRISSVQQSLDILASTAEAKSVKWERMKALLSGYQQSNGGSLVVWFVLPDGTYYTVDEGLMKVKLSDRRYFPGLMSGQRIVGDIVVSKSTGKRSAVIAVPVREGSNVIGAIGASLFLDGLSDQIGSALALRADVGFFVLAPSGELVLHKMTDRNFLNPRELGSEDFKKVTHEMLANSSGVTSYEFDKVARRVIYRASPLTRWKFAITFGQADKPGM